jgi:hypothetical protein
MFLVKVQGSDSDELRPIKADTAALRNQDFKAGMRNLKRAKTSGPFSAVIDSESSIFHWLW